MTAKIIPFRGITKLDMPAEHVLRGLADDGNLESVVVFGYTKDGDEFAASSIADGGTVLWLIERFKTKLLAVPESELFAE